MTPPSLIADRYQLLDRLGVGGMGEVWKAQDLRFESRIVALKLLKEDDTLRQDADNRQKLAEALRSSEASGLSTAVVETELDAALRAGKGADELQALVKARAGDSGRLTSDAVLALYDELVNNATVCENARTRARMRKLFRDEANAVANLRHDNVVGISDYGEFNGAPYLVMSYIEGQTLARIIQRRAPLTRIRQLELMENLCAGLAYAHEHKLVHRDIKPANLIVDDATGSLKILDFGVVRRLRADSQSTVGVAIGTVCYMSPEQIRGLAVDHRSDIFSVGDVFYELLTRQMAFPVGEGGLEIVDLMSRIQSATPTPVRQFVPDIEPEIEAILDRALQKDVNARYQSLTDMQHDLARLRGRLENENQTVRIVGSTPSGAQAVSGAETVRVTPLTPARTLRPPSAVGADDETRLKGTPLPGTAASTIVTPSAVPALGSPTRRPLVIGGLAAAVLAGVAIAWVVWPKPASPSPVAPIAALAQASLVSIDVHPWARVKIVGLDDAKPPASPGSYTTPFLVQLQPGRYRLDCENGSQTTSFEITVEPGQALRVDKPMPGFDADAIVNQLIGKK